MAVTTVATAIPAQSPDDLSVWPATTVRGPHGDPTVSGVELLDVAEQFGTPVYVLDETDVRERCRAYRSAFPGADVLYAAKAFLCRAMVHWVHEEGLGLDVCSAGELELAVIAGLPPERIVFHGHAQRDARPEDLRAALRHGVGRIVVDSTSEIARCRTTCGPGTSSPCPWRARTTCRWRPPTTSWDGRPSSPWRTGGRGSWCAASRPRTSGAAT
jgi:diaminopimelate decarboxylase